MRILICQNNKCNVKIHLFSEFLGESAPSTGSCWRERLRRRQLRASCESHNSCTVIVVIPEYIFPMKPRLNFCKRWVLSWLWSDRRERFTICRSIPGSMTWNEKMWIGYWTKWDNREASLFGCPAEEGPLIHSLWVFSTRIEFSIWTFGKDQTELLL